MDYFYFTLVLAMLVVIAIVAAEFYYVKCRKDATEKWYEIVGKIKMIEYLQSIQLFDLIYHMDTQERNVLFGDYKGLEAWYEEHFEQKNNENDDKEM